MTAPAVEPSPAVVTDPFLLVLGIPRGQVVRWRAVRVGTLFDVEVWHTGGQGRSVLVRRVTVGQLARLQSIS